MIARTPRPAEFVYAEAGVEHDEIRTPRHADARSVTVADVALLVARLGIGAAGVFAFSGTVSAHDLGHWGLGRGDGAAAFGVVLVLPTVAGLVGGYLAVCYRRLRRRGVAVGGSDVAVGVLLVGIGAAGLLPAVVGHRWLSIAGACAGAAIALWIGGDRPVPGIGCGNHVELTLGSVSVHRVIEGVVVGSLYSVGAAVGLFGAVLIACHTALETAAVGGLYAGDSRRTGAVGAIVIVQGCYVVGAVAGFGFAGALPVSARTFVLAVVGGTLLVVGASETGRSVTVG